MDQPEPCGTGGADANEQSTVSSAEQQGATTANNSESSVMERESVLKMSPNSNGDEKAVLPSVDDDQVGGESSHALVAKDTAISKDQEASALDGDNSAPAVVSSDAEGSEEVVAHQQQQADKRSIETIQASDSQESISSTSSSSAQVSPNAHNAKRPRLIRSAPVEGNSPSSVAAADQEDDSVAVDAKEDKSKSGQDEAPAVVANEPKEKDKPEAEQDVLGEKEMAKEEQSSSSDGQKNSPKIYVVEQKDVPPHWILYPELFFDEELEEEDGGNGGGNNSEASSKDKTAEEQNGAQNGQADDIVDVVEDDQANGKEQEDEAKGDQADGEEHENEDNEAADQANRSAIRIQVFVEAITDEIVHLAEDNVIEDVQHQDEEDESAAVGEDIQDDDDDQNASAEATEEEEAEAADISLDILGDQPVAAIMGVDEPLRRRLVDDYEDTRESAEDGGTRVKGRKEKKPSGITKAYELLAWYLILRQDEDQYIWWFNRNIGATDKQMNGILTHLRAWCDQHLGSGETQEHDFITEPMCSKPTTVITGLGAALGERLKRWRDPETEENVEFAYQLFGWFLRFRKDLTKFTTWLCTEVAPGTPQKTAEVIHKELDTWAENFL